MATLVQFLAAGVNGAANGSAVFLLRGTASSAQSVMYNEFEALTQPPSNTITLDANGAAEVYVEAYVDVELKNSAGTTLRTVTVGNSAPLVEVQSTSFRGTDYDGSPANTIGEPITLKAVLDKWIVSAGAPDWQILVDGVATDLDVALAGFSGMFTNVKDPQFGATGDGVTDDTTAILAATTAAAGGIVFFPPGTYKMTTLSLSGANINWLGSGAGASIISGTTDSILISLTDNTDTAWKNFTSLGFGSSGTYGELFSLENNQNVSFKNCAFDASLCTNNAVEIAAQAGLSYFYFTDCDFILGASLTRGIRNRAATGNRSINVHGCTFSVPSGFTGSIIQGAEFNVTNCTFDASSVTSGVYRHIDATDVTTSGKYVGIFNGNKFLDGGSSGFVFKLTGMSAGCDFAEDSNIFIGFEEPSATAQKGQTYEITDAESGIPGDLHLGSRKGRTLHISFSATSFTASMCLEAAHLVLEATSTSSVTIALPALVPGLTGSITIENNNGGPAINYLLDDSAGDSPHIDISNGGEQPLTLGGGGGTVFSVDYYTTVLTDGTFRSFVTSMIEHT